MKLQIYLKNYSKKGGKMSKMDKMTMLQCENCGGTLYKNSDGNYVCHYCGTVYRDENKEIGFNLPLKNPYDDAPTKLVVLKPGVRVFGWSHMISRYDMQYMNPDEMKYGLKRWFIDELSQFLWEHFDEIVDFEKEFDLNSMNDIYRARLRFLDKSNKSYR